MQPALKKQHGYKMAVAWQSAAWPQLWPVIKPTMAVFGMHPKYLMKNIRNKNINLCDLNEAPHDPT